MDMAKGDTIMQCSSLEEVRSNIDRIDNEIIKPVSYTHLVSAGYMD